MKYDLVSAINAFFKEIGRDELDEDSVDAIDEIIGAGFPETNGLRLDRDKSPKGKEDFAVTELALTSYDGELRPCNLTIKIDEVETSYLYFNNPERGYYSVYDLDNDENLEYMVFRYGNDTIVYKYDHEEEKGIMRLYTDLPKDIERKNGVPVGLEPDFEIKIDEDWYTDSLGDEYTKYIYEDEEDILIPGGYNETYFASSENLDEDDTNALAIRECDTNTQTRAYRAIGQIMSEKYHENYLFNEKPKVLKKEKSGKIKLEG